MSECAQHPPAPLYLPALEHDACGIALVASPRGIARHDLVVEALAALARLAHRGGGAHTDAPPDGAGLLLQIPWTLLEAERAFAGAPDPGRRALGMFFLPRGAGAGIAARIDQVTRPWGWRVTAWREVPVDPTALPPGSVAPAVSQAVFRDEGGDASRRRLWLARLALERLASGIGPEAALVSLSTKTVVYKGLVRPADLGRFYPDLTDLRTKTAMAIVHERFSTNTLPRWPLAQPFHMLAHNGEINTVTGNRRWMLARARALARRGHVPAGTAIVPGDGSDSQSLDAALGWLCAEGLDPVHALRRLIMPAWRHDRRLGAAARHFFAHQEWRGESWEGPAAIAFTDGETAGACLDRNGLRPARYFVSRGGDFYLASEAGVFDAGEGAVRMRGRLGPGDIVTVDTRTHEVQTTSRLQPALARRAPYRSWLPVRAASDRERPAPSRGREELAHLERRFALTREEQRYILEPMARDGREGIGSMGDDTPLACLSAFDRPLAHFFRQRFAQVTNPPIDPIRERRAMALDVILGPRPVEAADGPVERAALSLSSPIVGPDIHELLHRAGVEVATLKLAFDEARGPTGLQHALDTLAAAACDAAASGKGVICLSDDGLGPSDVAVPPLLAVARVHQALVETGLRFEAGLLVETGEARDPHQVATLLAFGANAVHPWLGRDVVAAGARERGDDPCIALARYARALDDGLLKICSKMGIPTVASYVGAEAFEILGLDTALCADLFPGAPARLGGLDLAALGGRALVRHGRARGAEGWLDDPGFHGYRRRGEYHAFNPQVVRRAREAAYAGSDDAYAAYLAEVGARPCTHVRDLLEWTPVEPVPIDRVEPVESICRRFFASAMSIGALSPEAHRVVAEAMNLLGARSNSGEGGEEPERRGHGARAGATTSTTRQVASGRFGVTPGYLLAGDEIQIKMAQGAKPGEGGQLPASKVVAHIARLRHAPEGTALISPPPHHDIYSIEDLAQLIADLREVHPGARINVKLVAQAGVGIVAAGVAKAGADAIQISGHDGGTGASPRSSMKHAGAPWELGLAEAHQVLTRNGLRGRVVLQVDGGFKTGRDVLIAAALGADEFGFGTATLVALGCVMARQCHANTCPTGIATQREDLRARFPGRPEQLVQYFRQVARDVRQQLAGLGLTSIDDIVGRADLLRQREVQSLGLAPSLDLTALLVGLPRHHPREPNPLRAAGAPGDLAGQLERIVVPALGRRPLEVHRAIRNTDRSVGARLAGAIVERLGDAALPDGSVVLHLAGTAGQSFGAFLVDGLTLRLTGEANDYVGKGMAGGEISIRPRVPRPAGAMAKVLAGNTILYGATGGRVFIAGAAGERFAVRNAGAVAVVEGVGDHACEYMTGGLVVVLGVAGRNVGAGMTGGLALFHDPRGRLAHLHHEDVRVEPLGEADRARLHALLQAHVAATGSARASRILQAWPADAAQFVRVVPATAPDVRAATGAARTDAANVPAADAGTTRAFA